MMEKDNHLWALKKKKRNWSDASKNMTKYGKIQENNAIAANVFINLLLI